MKKRYLFSGVEQFALYDFMAEGGGVDEDVYAYSNGMGNERALVLYNNKFKDSRGRIFRAIPTRREDGSTTAPNVAEALGIDVGQGDWMIFRDASKGLEYLRPMREIDGGFFWELGAFKYHVLHEFRGVNATATKPYAELAAALAGRGVPSIERALVELKYRPVHEPLRQALGAGHLAYLASGWDAKKAAPTKEAIVALEERIRYIADGLAYMRERARGASAATAKAAKGLDPEPVLATLRERYAAILARVHTPVEEKAGIHLRGNAGADASANADASAKADTSANAKADAKVDAARWTDAALLLAWAHVEAVIDLVEDAEPGLERAEIIARWELALPVLAAFSESNDGYSAQRRTALVLLGASLPAAPLREVLASAFRDARARTFLGVHEANGVFWLAKEAFEELARLVADREVVLGRISVALAERQVEEVARLAAEQGYRAEPIVKALVADVKLEPKPASLPGKNDRANDRPSDRASDRAERTDKSDAASVKRPSS
ncbi:MAG: hypothetical protein QOI41_1562, partial [Myxococcales bacterium]|nr:hypothetical protein [Myxococcales bacterium]